MGKGPNRDHDGESGQAMMGNLPAKDFVVTDKTCQVIGCLLSYGMSVFCMGPKHLYLSPEEARFTHKSCCVNIDSKRPYGELGSVDEVDCCGCFKGFSTDLLGKQGAALFPGNGCNSALRDELVKELKLRMRARGETGLVKRAEQQDANMMYVKEVVKKMAEKLGCDISYLVDPNPYAKEGETPGFGV